MKRKWRLYLDTSVFGGCFDAAPGWAEDSRRVVDAALERLAQYLRTRFVRFLVAQLSFSQDITKERFFFVPVLIMNTQWTDEQLYKRYGLTKDDIAFIESKIRPMEANNE